MKNILYLQPVLLWWLRSSEAFCSVKTTTSAVGRQYARSQPTCFFKTKLCSTSLSSSASPYSENVDTEETPTGFLPNFESWAVGVRRDFGNRLPEYKSDITDGVNAQTLATILFLFFACLAPAIGFGSVLGAATGGQMGVIEMVASTSLSGVLYAMLSAQPIQLIGPQGPVVAYIAALYQLSNILQVPFLPLYAWTGLWSSGFLAIMAGISASNLVQHLTRWTDEIFSVLVSTLFLFQAVTDISKTFVGTNTATAALKALLTLTCASLTTGVAFTLRNLPKSRYLTASWRKNLANFAPAIGVVVGSLAARAARLQLGTSLAALALPTQFVTSTGRPWWMLSMGGALSTLPVSARWLAAVPAFLAAILLYLDQNITARLINHPRFKQVKGKRTSVMDGLHGDMLALSFITALASALGLPWMCGAPTRSAAHVRALSKLDDQGQVVGTVEQRVSGFFIHALIGVCALAAGPRQLLAQVPQAVLSGVFLYLGVTSLQGLELWDRVKGLCKDVADERFASVPRRVVTLFTMVQMACVAAMMKVTQSKFGVLSPLLIAFLPVARWGLIRSGLVSKDNGKVLDN